MTANLKKTLLIGLGIFFVIVASIAVVYLVRKPEPVVTQLPTPAPFNEPRETVAPAPVFQVVPEDAKCEMDIVVACGSASPSTSPSGSPSSSPSISPSPAPEADLACVSKKMYEDDTRNRAGFYYMEKTITDTNTLQNGQIILYNITVKNTGGYSVPDTTITDNLSSTLTYLDGDSGCTYDSATRVVTCTVGTLAASSEAQRSFRVKVTVGGTQSVANTAEVSSTNGQRDSCSVTINANGIVVTPPPTSSEAPVALPVAGVFEVTVGTVGMGLLLLIAGVLGLLLI